MNLTKVRNRVILCHANIEDQSQNRSLGGTESLVHCIYSNVFAFITIFVTLIPASTSNFNITGFLLYISSYNLYFGLIW